MPARGDRNGHPADPLPPAGTERLPPPRPMPIRMLALHSARLMRDLAARGGTAEPARAARHLRDRIRSAATPGGSLPARA